MDPSSAIELHIMAGQKIDALWEFFVMLHFGLIAAVYGINSLHKLTIWEYSILLFGYLFYSIVNLIAKLDAYELLNEIVIQVETTLKVDAKETFNLSPSLINYYADPTYNLRDEMVFAAHGAALVGIIALTCFQRKFDQKNDSNKGDRR